MDFKGLPERHPGGKPKGKTPQKRHNARSDFDFAGQKDGRPSPGDNKRHQGPVPVGKMHNESTGKRDY